jgi:hypothetical protein
MSDELGQCARCRRRAAVAWVNDVAVCNVCGGAELQAIGDIGRAVAVDIVGPRAFDVRPIESVPAFGAGNFGLGRCRSCSADAIVMVDDEPHCLEHFRHALGALHERLYGGAA